MYGHLLFKSADIKFPQEQQRILKSCQRKNIYTTERWLDYHDIHLHGFSTSEDIRLCIFSCCLIFIDDNDSLEGQILKHVKWEFIVNIFIWPFITATSTYTRIPDHLPVLNTVINALHSRNQIVLTAVILNGSETSGSWVEHLTSLTKWGT